MKIGLCWAGSPGYHRDWARSTILAQWWPLLQLPDTEWVVLLTGERRDDLEGADVPNLTAPDLPDWGVTLRYIQTCDLILTVDTAMAHVAGSAGVPTWVLLPTPADYRWLEHRIDSPWYPSVTLYRQTVMGDWWAVLDAVRRDLVLLLHQRAA